MDNLEQLVGLLGRPKSPLDFEIQHQVKLLRIEIVKMKKELSRSEGGRLQSEEILSATLEELKQAKNNIRKLKRKSI